MLVFPWGGSGQGTVTKHINRKRNSLNTHNIGGVALRDLDLVRDLPRPLGDGDLDLLCLLYGSGDLESEYDLDLLLLGDLDRDRDLDLERDRDPDCDLE